MNTIDIALGKLTQYMSWLCSELGLAKWQLLTITIAVIILLILIAIRQRKKKAKPIHTIQPRYHSEIIGINLATHGASHPEIEDTKQHNLASVSKKDGTQKWKQTTKEWRKATEQIRQLKHEITKHKRTEEHLRQKITELTTSNRQAIYETTESVHAKHNIMSKPAMMKTLDKQIQEVNQSEQADKYVKQQPVEHTATNKEHRKDVTEDEKSKKDMKQQNTDLTTTEQPQQEITNHENQVEELKRKITEDDGAPLDVQELKSIAELARRLRGNNRQQQNK